MSMKKVCKNCVHCEPYFRCTTVGKELTGHICNVSWKTMGYFAQETYVNLDDKCLDPKGKFSGKSNMK